MFPRLKQYFIPVLLFSLSLLIRLSLISKGPYHSDSLFFAMNVDETWRTHQIHFLHGHGYPFLAITGALFFGFLKTLGSLDPFFAVNLLSVITSALCLFPLYAICKNLFDPLTALVTTLLFCVSPLFLSTSVYGNSHTLFLLLALLTIFFILRYKTNDQPHLLWWGTLCWGLAGATRIQDLIFTSLAMAWLFLFVPPVAEKKKWRDLAIVSAVSFFIIFLFYLPLFWQRTGKYYSTGFFRFNFLDPLSDLFPPYYLGVSAQYLIKNFHPLGIISILLGIFQLLKADRRKSIFLLLWVFIPFLVLGNHFFTTPRWHMPITVPLTIFQGYFLAKLISGKKTRFQLVGILLVLVLLIRSLTLMLPILLFRHEQALTPDFGRWVAAHTEPHALIIVGDDGSFISYFGQRKLYHQINTDTDVFRADKPLEKELREYKNTLDQFLAAGTPLYITEIGLFSNNTGLFFAFMTKYFQLTFVGEAPIEVWHRACIEQTLLNIKLYKITKKPAHP